MHTSYFSFGYGHTHRHNGKTLDVDCLLEITSDDPRETMFKNFGTKWSMQYDTLPKNMSHFPRGVIKFEE